MKLSKLILLVLLYLSDECRGQGDVSGGGIFGFFNQIFRRPIPPPPIVSVSTAFSTIVQTTTDSNLPGIVFGALSVTTKLVTVYTEPSTTTLTYYVEENTTTTWTQTEVRTETFTFPGWIVWETTTDTQYITHYVTTTVTSTDVSALVSVAVGTATQTAVHVIHTKTSVLFTEQTFTSVLTITSIKQLTGDCRMRQNYDDYAEYEYIVNDDEALIIPSHVQALETTSMATILTGPRRRIGEIDPSFPIVSSIQPSYEVKTGLEFID